MTSLSRRLRFSLLIVIAAIAVPACTLVRGSTSGTSDATATRALATPIAQSPAAGICAEMQGEVVTVTINPDMPDPRCSIVGPDQRLRVVNAREEPIQVKLADLEVNIDPAAEFTFGVSFGQLLEPGVHAFEVSPCCGAELVLGPIR